MFCHWGWSARPFRPTEQMISEAQRIEIQGLLWAQPHKVRVEGRASEVQQIAVPFIQSPEKGGAIRTK